MNKNKPTITIVIDTREQLEYKGFSPNIETIHSTLPAGDYSLLGRETEVAIERKSLDDFVQTVINQRDRFRKELKKLQTYNSACIIVEASADNIIPVLMCPRSNASPAAVWGATMSIIVDYGIPIYFLANRQIACKFVEDYLTRYYNRIIRARREETTPEKKQRAREAVNELLPPELRLPLCK